MESFRTFFEQQEIIDSIINEFNSAPVRPYSNNVFQTSQITKPWSAKKDEIINIWKNARSDTPIFMTPVVEKQPGQKGNSTYGEDGIRITGSWNFISSVLARIKEIISYENPQSKLRLVFRGIDRSKNKRLDRQSYAFYVNLEKRNTKKLSNKKII